MAQYLKRRFASERGIVLVASLLILALLVAGGLGAMFSMQTDLKSSGNLKSSKQAFYIADAGLSRAWQEMNDSDGINDFETLASGAGRVKLFYKEPFAGGSHTVTAEPIPGIAPKRIRVTSTGCLPAGDPCPSGQSKAILEGQFRRSSLLPCAICSTDTVSLSAGARIDSFDSRVAPYQSGNAGKVGHIHSSGDVSLDGATTAIGGNVFAGRRVSISNGATVDGVVTEGVVFQEPPPVTPCGSPYHDGSGISGGFYDPLTGQLRGSATDAITLANGTYCFSSVDLAAGATLAVNGPVQIHLTGHSNFTGGGVVNTTGNAENLLILSSLSSPDLGMLIASGSAAYMTVYAPRAKITIVGDGDLFGSVVGNAVVNTGAVRLHYDQKLTDNGDGRVTLVMWKEVF
jgi:hypothetical protein